VLGCHPNCILSMGHATYGQRRGARGRIILPCLAAAWDATSRCKSSHIEWFFFGLFSSGTNDYFNCSTSYLQAWKTLAVVQANFHRLFLSMCTDGCSNLFLFFLLVYLTPVLLVKSVLFHMLAEDGCKHSFVFGANLEKNIWHLGAPAVCTPLLPWSLWSGHTELA
jgi:hypothetical protein